MRYVSAGESHGEALTVVVTEVPAGLRLSQESLDRDLARRQVGYGRGGRMSIESDTAHVTSGIRHGRTLGSPVGLNIENKDFENWRDAMSPFGEEDDATRVTAPRPGHADLAGVQKCGATDIRDILERASARETAARVAAGAIAKALLAEVGVRVRSVVIGIGPVTMDVPSDISSLDEAATEASDVRCPDGKASQAMRDAIDAAGADGETLGGEFVVLAEGLTPGLGGYATAQDRLDAQLASAVISIPAIKAVGFGDAQHLGRVPGSKAHDEIVPGDEGGLRRSTNHAGGLEGGMSNGESLVVRATMKPIPTLMRPLATVDIDSGEVADASKERSDVCAVPAAAVVAEAEVALVLASAYTRKFGGDCIEDMLSALRAYEDRIST